MKRFRLHVMPEYPGHKNSWELLIAVNSDYKGKLPTKHQKAVNKYYKKKDVAISVAVAMCKDLEPSQLFIHRYTDNAIVGERTYPRSSDPRRTKG